MNPEGPMSFEVEVEGITMEVGRGLLENILGGADASRMP